MFEYSFIMIGGIIAVFLIEKLINLLCY